MAQRYARVLGFTLRDLQAALQIGADASDAGLDEDPVPASA